MIRYVFLFLFSLSIFYSNSFGQKQTNMQWPDNPAPLNIYDSIGLMNLPELTLSGSFLGSDAPLLPPSVYNSDNIYWRPVFAQAGLSCGQASGIGMGYTYEINRLRNLPSDVPENQYPSHFTWNFGNGGNGWYGVSYFHSFEIVRTLGNPTAQVYGGMSAGGGSRWMSGYDNYYHSMQNRLYEVYKIDVSDEDGIMTAKHWIHNHLEGDDVGGVANFYANAPGANYTLPPGTPEEGMYVVPSWGGANHGMTICCYNDDICWDYNNDGQYTNNIDITGDGDVTVQDWEIGGFRFANTYSGGPNWANNGFSYMMYKSCADPYGSGGIWDNAIHVQYAKENTSPLLTAKVTIKYDCRERIRVRMGATTELSSTIPQYVLGFPVFDFQGGCQYMQGGTEVEDNKTIEFGLDLTPFLNILGTAVPARYFLLVDENDPEGWGNGEIVQYSIIDYTNGINEIDCGQNNVTINANSQTKLWVDHIMEFDPVIIDMDTLPPATVFEPYTAQLTATGGTYPYFWNADLNFTETMLTETFPAIDDEQLYPGGSYATVDLDFVFPFYGHEFDAIRVYTDGYIMFEGQFSWPYTVYDFFHFAKNKMIAPFMSELVLSEEDDDGVWFEGHQNEAFIRWKASIEGLPNTTELNFAVRLSENGDIKFFYGPVNEYSGTEWLSGVSAGDNKYYQMTEISGLPTIVPSTASNLLASVFPEGFEVGHSGTLTGLPEVTYDDLGLKLMTLDENNLKASKVVYLSTDGANFLVIDDYSVTAGDDEVIELGDTVYLSVDIKNLGENLITGTNMYITIEEGSIQMIDSTELLGDFTPGEVKSFTDAFVFSLNNPIPNEYTLDIQTLIQDDGGSDWTSHIYLTAYSPQLQSGGASIDDGGNGSLDPGETANLLVEIFNTGGAEAINVEGELSTGDIYITINSSTSSILKIDPYSSEEFTFNVYASEALPIGHVVDFNIEYTAEFGIAGTGTFSIIAGQIPVLIVDLDPNSNSAPSIADALIELGISYEMDQTFPSNLNQYSSVFVCLGIYSDNHVLTNDEGQLLADYLNANGNLYMEGGDTWAYDSQTAVHPMFNINGIEDGTSDMTVVAGQDSTFTEGMLFSYIGDNNWMDHIEPISPAYLILENQDPVYGTGIAHDEGTYRTIGTAHEFGGLVDGTSPSTKAELMEKYLEFFGVISYDLIANFIAEPTQICMADTVFFTDYSVGNISTWKWEFEGGDPAISILQNPEVVYENPGIYDVSLIVSNGNYSDTIIKENHIVVFEYPGIPAAPTGPELVCTNFTSTSEFITAGGAASDSYSWEITPTEAGTISGNGTTGTVNWTLNWEGTALIRVKGYNDNCGEGEFSEPFEVTCEICTGIENNDEGSFLSFFPNPASDQLFIHPHVDLLNAKIQVFNLTDKLMFGAETDLLVNEKLRIDLSDLPAGLYILKVKVGTTEVNEKLIIN